MADKKSVITVNGAKKLEEELKYLKTIGRTEIAKKIGEARAQGDLSENAEYDAALQEQAEMEVRIRDIEQILKNSDIVSEEGDTSRVFVGAVVRILDIEENDEYDVTIVGTNESDSLSNKISNESPLGAALMNAEVGEIVTVSAPAGEFQYKVLDIKRQ